MIEFDYRPKDGTDPQGKHRVYFTCHPDDFSPYFDKICTDILKTHDCVIYYTKDMSAPITLEDGKSPLEDMNLFVVPVTLKLLTTPNRAMNSDIEYAKENGIPILPFLMEADEETQRVYSKEDKFGKRQHFNPNSTDETEICYRKKLENYLDSVLINNELTREVRAAFYAQIFLSYRKKDRAYANRLMKLIHDIPGCQNLSIWYDEFLVFGEDWRESILKAMQSSASFAMLVTPNLLEEKNFVMKDEYPWAKDHNMDIIPVKMGDVSDSDKKELIDKLDPNVIIAPDDAEFKERFINTLKRSVTQSSNDPRHNFLIGLAFLDGIGVELDRSRGIGLISDAANEGVTEAIEKLIDIYSTNRIQDAVNEIKWRERLLEAYKSNNAPREKIIKAMSSLATAYYELPPYEEKAIALLKERFELQCEGLEESHPDRLAAIADIVAWGLRLYRLVNGIDMAPALFDQITSQGCRVNQNLLDSLRDVVCALSDLGDCMTALKWERAIYKLKCRALDQNDEEILLSLNSIASLLIECENPEAISAKEDAYKAYCNLYGPESDKSVIMKVELGNVYFKFKKHVEGKDVIEEAYFTACKRFDRNHPLSIDALYSLAITNLQTKNHDAAIEQLKEVLDWRRTYLGETDEKTANTCYYLGKAYYSAEYYDQAINVLENAKGLIQQLINDAQNAYENPISLEDMQKSVYAMLAEAHLQLKSYKEAYECQKKVCMYEDMLDPFSDESEEASRKLKSIRELISK